MHAWNPELMLYVLWETLTTKPELMTHVLYKAHVHISALIVNELKSIGQ